MSRKWTFNFQEQFVGRVERGEKTQTIRADRKDKKRPAAGDIALCFKGLRKKGATKIHEGIIYACFSVTIDFVTGKVLVGERALGFEESTDFARADGFNSRMEMIRWFKEVHEGDSFTGYCVRWRKFGEAA